MWATGPQTVVNRGGYRLTDGGEPVARARRVKRRPRERGAVRQNFPEAMLRICPGYPTADGGEWGSQTAVNRGGYRLTDGGEPVARARRVKRRPRERGAVRQNFPEAMLRICPGYPTADGGEWGSQTAVNRGGYRLTDGGEPVARARRVKRRPREQSLARVGKFTAIAPLLSLRTPPPGRGNRRPGL